MNAIPLYVVFSDDDDNGVDKDQLNAVENSFQKKMADIKTDIEKIKSESNTEELKELRLELTGMLQKFHVKKNNTHAIGLDKRNQRWA